MDDYNIQKKLTTRWAIKKHQSFFVITSTILDQFGKFYCTLWLIYPRHCISIPIKVGQVLRRSYDKKLWCVFYAPPCTFNRCLVKTIYS